MNWSRYSNNGYEISSVGDRKYSARYAKLKDGRTIEDAYQLDVKGYRKLGYDWLQAKRDHGKNAPNFLTKEQLWSSYLALWKQWAKENPILIQELYQKTKNKVLTDKFASSQVNQARALAVILTEYETNLKNINVF